MKRPSLRWLLLGSVLATLTLAFGAFAFYINHEQRTSRLNDIDSELVRASRSFPQAEQPPRAGTGGAGPSTRSTDDPPDRPEPPRGPGLQEGPDSAAIDAGAIDAGAIAPLQLILTSSGTIDRQYGSADVPFDEAALLELAGRVGFSTYESPSAYRVLVERLPNGNATVTALSAQNFEDAMADLQRALLVGGGIILALVTAVLWILTGFLSRPVTRMAETARKIADGELATSVEPPSGSRETFGLANDLDRMLTRLRGALNNATEARATTERLLADMSHEIRTPLTALKGYSDLYAQGMLSEKAEVDHAMSRIGSESSRLHTLANGMLQLARTGMTDEATSHFDISAVAREVTQDLRAAHPMQDIVIEAPSTPLTVFGGRARMHQALLNLGSNACRYNPPPSPVVVRITQVDTCAEVRIVDHGEGVDASEAERIFLPFYRSSAARSRVDDSGAGLGLALTRSIADQHRAALSVEETLGGGATFVLAVPLSAG